MPSKIDKLTINAMAALDEKARPVKAPDLILKTKEEIEKNKELKLRREKHVKSNELLE